MDSEYIKYKSADIVSRCLPRPLAYWIGLRIADRFFYADCNGRKAVMGNLSKVMEFKGIRSSRSQLRFMARRTFQNFGKYMVDFFRYGQFTREKVERMVSLEHPERIEQAVNFGNGVIVITAHYGSWEIAGAVLSALGYPVNVIVLPESNKRTDRLFKLRREGRGVKSIPIGYAATGALKALRRRELVGILADRNYGRNQNQFKFFGVPTFLPAGPATLSLRTNAPIAPVFLVRQSNDSYMFRFREPVIPEKGDTLESIQYKICRILEDEISKDPMQWYMFRAFWNYSGKGGGGHER